MLQNKQKSLTYKSQAFYFAVLRAKIEHRKPQITLKAKDKETGLLLIIG